MSGDRIGVVDLAAMLFDKQLGFDLPMQAARQKTRKPVMLDSTRPRHDAKGEFDSLESMTVFEARTGPHWTVPPAKALGMHAVASRRAYRR